MNKPVPSDPHGGEQNASSVLAGLQEIARALDQQGSQGEGNQEDDAWEDDEPDGQSLEDEALEVAQREVREGVKDRKQVLEHREREAKDRRSRLLKAVRTSAPEINQPLVETFQRLSLENHEFAQKELVRIFKNDAQLQNSLDFFDLNLAQREDLLDRIGFYKGIVIDHSLSNPVETGFREVLRRASSQADDGDENQVASLLYRKPNFSGYYENYYTSSESLHQVQKNGVTDIKSSLTVEGGKAVSVGVGVSGAYYDADGSNVGGKKKKLYITANFFLPKVELSFDDSVPCASLEFEAACEEALTAVTEEARFTALVAVLGKFGQFIPTQTLVGGRLFATDVKDFKGEESESEMTNRYAASLKVGVESVTASFESDTTVEHGKQTNSRGNDRQEQQQYTIHAVGGEGAVVEQAGLWAESLYEYQRWSAVQREKLIPSIDVLSKNLCLRVWENLKSFAAKNSAMHLVGAYKAYFLFYGDYDLKIGQLTKRDIVIFKNNNSQHCLAVLGETPQSGEIKGRPFDGTQQMLWRVTPHGHVVSSIPVSTGFPGQKKTVEFALTVTGTVPDQGATKPATFAVGLAELGAGGFQRWEFTGKGELRNRAFGDGYALSMPLDDKPVLRLMQQGSHDSTSSWSVQEATAAELEKIETNKVYGKLLHPSGLVLAIDGYEDSAQVFTVSDRRRLLLQPDNGGKHQLWHVRPDGTIISAIAIGSSNAAISSDIVLAYGADHQLAAQCDGITVKAFKADARGVVSGVSGMYAGAAVLDNVSGQQVGLVTDERIAVRFAPLPAGVRPVAYAGGLSTEVTGGCYRLKTVDKRELPIMGYVTGIEFILEERRKNLLLKIDEYFRMRMRVSVMRSTGKVDPVELTSEPDDDTDRDFLSDSSGNCDVRIDDRFLLLPEEPIYSLRLRIHGTTSKRLAFEYRKVEHGPWIGLSDNNDQARMLNVNLLKVSSKLDEATLNGAKVVGLAMEYDELSQLLRPKLLRRLIG